MPVIGDARLNRNRDALTVAHHDRRDLALRRCLLHQSRELTHAPNPLAIELDDDIAVADAGLRGRAVFLHVFDQHTGHVRELEPLGILAVDVSDRNAYLTSATRQDLHDAGLFVDRPRHVLAARNRSDCCADPGSDQHRGYCQHLHTHSPEN